MDFSNYKFRCSALGKIMSAKGDITKGNETYLRELFIGELYGIKKEISSKYLEKGKYMEEDAVNMINKLFYPDNLLLKNKERKYNKYIHGECDVISPDDIIWDAKNAWDLFTFGKADLSEDYYWQGIGYMLLWKKKKFRLFYCINNMPEHLLIDEERKIFYQNHFVSYEDLDYQILCKEMRDKHNYDNIPIYEKFKVWDVEYNESEAVRLINKIEKCRTFLNKLAKEHEESIKKNKSLIKPSYIAEHDTQLNAIIIQ